MLHAGCQQRHQRSVFRRVGVLQACLSKAETAAQGTLTRDSSCSHSATPGWGAAIAENSSPYALATFQASSLARPQSCVHLSTCMRQASSFHWVEAQLAAMQGQQGSNVHSGRHRHWLTHGPVPGCQLT